MIRTYQNIFNQAVTQENPRKELVSSDQKERETIRNVIFDLGGVLITFDPRAFIRQICQDEKSSQALFSLIFESPEWVQLDRGLISIEQAKNIYTQREPALQDSIEKFHREWMDMFHPIEDTIDILKALHEKNVNLYVLSNFIQESFQILRPQFHFLNLFKGIVVSFEIGHVKPEKEIFDHLLQTYNLEPSESLFIDDLRINVNAAQSSGIQTILFQSPQSLRKELESIGLL